MSPDRVIARAIASAAAGLNDFSFLRCSTLDFICAYLGDVEAKPAGREVGMLAAIAKKVCGFKCCGRRAIPHTCYSRIKHYRCERWGELPPITKAIGGT